MTFVSSGRLIEASSLEGLPRFLSSSLLSVFENDFFRTINVAFTYGKLLKVFGLKKPEHDGAALVDLFADDGSFAPHLHFTSSEQPMHTSNGKENEFCCITCQKAAYYGRAHSDALTVVVSETNGRISTFHNGHVECGVDPDRQEELLRQIINEGSTF